LNGDLNMATKLCIGILKAMFAAGGSVSG
jgi:hypothetical protein